MTYTVVLIAVASLLLFSGSVYGTANSYTPSCTLAEQSSLFNECLMSFGFQHWRHRSEMMKSSTCLTERLQCSAAKSAVECMNRLPTNRLSSVCWSGMSDTLSHMMMKFHFGCSFQDVERTCGSIIPPLANRLGQPSTQRAQNGPL